MKFRLKSLMVALTLGVTCAARAASVADIDDPSALDAYVAQARQMQIAQAQQRARQRETIEGDIAASPSTNSQGPKGAASQSTDANQQILAQLIGIHTTLQQLLELERSKASTASR